MLINDLVITSEVQSRNPDMNTSIKIKRKMEPKVTLSIRKVYKYIQDLHDFQSPL